MPTERMLCFSCHLLPVMVVNFGTMEQCKIYDYSDGSKPGGRSRDLPRRGFGLYYSGSRYTTLNPTSRKGLSIMCPGSRPALFWILRSDELLSQEPPRIILLIGTVPSLGGPLYETYHSLHHSHTFPLISNNPRALGVLLPTSWAPCSDELSPSALEFLYQTA